MVKPKVGVILTKEAREVLAEDSIQLFLSRGNYFNCESVEQNGHFLDMKVLYTQKDVNRIFDVSIPLSYVQYMVSVEASNALGFGPNESTCEE